MSEPADPHRSEDENEDEEAFSLDDLGAAYARAMAESGLLPENASVGEASAEGSQPGEDAAGLEETEPDETPDDQGGISPMAIVEAALFVGHPENRPLSAATIAATIRGVSAEEVEQIVDELNAEYAQHGHAFHIERREGGLVFGLTEPLRSVRNAFYGKVRETRLTQAAIDVLALVAYQPGVTAAILTEQRGKDASGVANQMVRRELLEVRRESADGGKAVPRYYPTARLLNLLGLRSLEDLPQVDEDDIAPRM